MTPLSVDALRALPGVREARREADGFAITTSEVHRAVPALLDALDTAEHRLSMLTTHSATLEDVFVALTGRHLRDA